MSNNRILDKDGVELKHPERTCRDCAKYPCMKTMGLDFAKYGCVKFHKK